MSLLLGYVRVSLLEPDPEPQFDALTAEGCFRIWVDHATGTLDRRPHLVEVLGRLQPGDVLVVQRLDRLGRSLRDLVGTVSGLHEREVGFRSLQEDIDTTADGGAALGVFTGLAVFERRMIRELTVAGLEEARAEGRLWAARGS